MSPYTKKGDSKGNLTFPCGKCYDCLTRRTSEWSFRLRMEGRHSVSAHFVTLTYDTKSVPITKNGYMSVQKKEIQDFIKRLRHHKKQRVKIQRTIGVKVDVGLFMPIKYYAVGEYGTERERPHYHIILFNAELEDIYKSWGKGIVDIGQVEDASIGYTLLYISEESDIPRHVRDDRQKQFALMSKGMGMQYVTEKMTKWHQDVLLDRMYVPIEGGKKISMPRVYREKIYSREQIETIINNLIVNSEEVDVDKEISQFVGKSRKLKRKKVKKL